ncbi:hypothetical protein DTO006G1_4978 [Penicillium roqueforti]|uniref:uncharacterized protein n=1 Tax=Penicillium roqueforti TaxID=5082 RepID=UPI00190C1DD5|nr:uncharacterized protein LCP9604111_8310 [Penicillium roqueforti]KAF9241701.1 hypothetical protein LCP9604111_8310 [Penicillium roqueforti]KAI1833610.1 hypothetical protein CBS147337_5649 [Penicillium roqueforti]KAI2672974.1 hypothetical protein CBS147355_7777 [Penicillium roqueforti]KAI2674252.1 hypothetical protein LCP963914a_8868 [Penicillium roqueforti]KAI2720395.1 hypothetical protein CBS147318_3701 [Penicillium roqueforti]
MTVIAVAGGTGGVGKTIVEKLLDSNFDIVVLSRTVKRDFASQNIQNVQINYDDIPSIARVLEKHNIHTIISAIGLVSDETSQSQLNLIEAAEKSATTKRFIPSEYSFVQTTELLPIDPSIQYWLDAADRLKASGLQYTRIIPGFFMDYWGMPHIQTHLQPFTFGIDISSGTAAIPGDGNNVICMTYTYDMASYLVKALDLDEWPEFSVIVGDEITYNQILGMAEEFTGRKFKVTYDSLEQIKAGDVTVPLQPEGIEYSSDELKEVTALVSRLTVNNVFRLPDDRLNTRFPEVKPTTMRQILHNAWNRNSA